MLAENGDDVLVMLITGETLLKRLHSQDATGIFLGDFSGAEVKRYEHADVTWMYCVSYAIPARRVHLYTGMPRAKQHWSAEAVPV